MHTFLQPCDNHWDLHIYKMVKLFWQQIICKCVEDVKISFFAPAVTHEV